MMCKYCLSECSHGIYPCNCTTPVHKECLRKWLIHKDINECEICHAEYENMTSLYFMSMDTRVCMVSCIFSIGIVSLSFIELQIHSIKSIDTLIILPVIGLYTFIWSFIIGHVILWRVC